MTKPADPQRVRDTVLRAVAQRPGIGQAELASRVATATRASKSAVVAAIRELEREGVLATRRVDRHKVYEPAQASPLELARKAEIERIVAAGPPAAEAPPPPVSAADAQGLPAASAPPPPVTPAPRPETRAPATPAPAVAAGRIPAWGWAVLALVALAWNLLVFRLLAGD